MTEHACVSLLAIRVGSWSSGDKLPNICQVFWLHRDKLGRKQGLSRNSLWEGLVLPKQEEKTNL